MENYIIINGKKAELTKEQLEKLGIKPKRNNPFDRAEHSMNYYIPSNDGKVLPTRETGGYFDNLVYDNAFYFNDKAFAEQVALHQLLYRKLLKYSWDNEAEDVEWDKAEDVEWHNSNRHFCIVKNKYAYVQFRTEVENRVKTQGVVYFSKREIAEKAIGDVVKPFVKEHPNFRW